MSKYKNVFLSEDIILQGFVKLPWKVKYFNPHYTLQSQLSQSTCAANIILDVEHEQILSLAEIK